METLEKIHESGVAPNEFWYLSTLILTGILVIFMGILIIFVKGFFADLKETITSLKNNLEKITEMVRAHDNDIKFIKTDVTTAQADIKDLEKRRR